MKTWTVEIVVAQEADARKRVVKQTTVEADDAGHAVSAALAQVETPERVVRVVSKVYRRKKAA